MDEARYSVEETLVLTAMAIEMSKDLLPPEKLPKLPNGKTFPTEGKSGVPV
jgi:hypothetical protein